MPEQCHGIGRYLVVSRTGDFRSVRLTGRNKWTLDNLLTAGPKGCSSWSYPAPRWAAYVHVLRREFGFDIETIPEQHGGPFKGTHARYVLRSQVIPMQLAPAQAVSLLTSKSAISIMKEAA